MDQTQNETLIAEQVRKGHWPLYLASLREKRHVRRMIWSLLALHLEAERAIKAASEPITRAIRLQWWKDALQEIEEGKAPRQHPLVLTLAMLHHDNVFSPSNMQGIVNAYDNAVENVLMHDTATKKALAETLLIVAQQLGVRDTEVHCTVYASYFAGAHEPASGKCSRTHASAFFSSIASILHYYSVCADNSEYLIPRKLSLPWWWPLRLLLCR